MKWYEAIFEILKQIWILFPIAGLILYINHKKGKSIF